MESVTYEQWLTSYCQRIEKDHPVHLDPPLYEEEQKVWDIAYKIIREHMKDYPVDGDAPIDEIDHAFASNMCDRIIEKIREELN